MGRKRKKKEPVVITRESLLYQPLSLAVSGYEATSLQQNIIIALLRKLRGCIKAVRNEQFQPQARQLTLFSENKEVAKYGEQGEFRFEIHMSELGVQPKHYPQAFDMIYNQSDVIVYVPDTGDPTGKKMRRTKLFDTSDENVTREEVDGRMVYKYKARSPVSTIIISKPVMDYLFNADSRIYDFIDDTAMMISEKFPKRIYLYLSTKKTMGTFRIDYWKFRHDIGINDKEAPVNPDNPKERLIIHPYFSYFAREVLKPAMRILKEMCEQNLCDFYFEYEPIYHHSKRAKNPDELEITIHLSELGNSIKADKSIIRENIGLEKQLMEELNQTKSQVSVLMKKLTAENRAAFIGKVKHLTEAKKGNEKIKDLRAWANRSLTLFFEQQAPVALPFVEGATGQAERSEAPDADSSQKPGMTGRVTGMPEGTATKWYAFLSAVQCGECVSADEYSTWFTNLKPLAYDPEKNVLTIGVPTRTFAEILMQKYQAVIDRELRAVFGEGVQVTYTARP